MGWLIFGLAAWLIVLLIVPIKQWKKSWPVGIASLIILYCIDASLSALGAFNYNHAGKTISNLPIYYWLSSFPAGILFDYFRPTDRWKRVFYIFVSALVLWFLEWVMLRLGYFQHLHWNLFKSFILNLGGFTIVSWIAEWLDSGRKSRLNLS